MSHWFKFTTNGTRMPNGGKYQIHGYANKKTKKVIYSDDNPEIGLKLKINTNGKKGVDKYPNLDSKIKNIVSSNKESNELPFKKIKSQKLIIRKKQKVKPSKLDLLIEHQKKVLIIYEELRKIKNLLNMSRKDTSKS